MGFRESAIKLLRSLAEVDNHSTDGGYESRRGIRSEPGPNRLQDYNFCLRTMVTLMIGCLDETQKRDAKRRKLSISNVQELFPFFIEQWQLEEFGETDVVVGNRRRNTDRELNVQRTGNVPRGIGYGIGPPLIQGPPFQSEGPPFRSEGDHKSEPLDLRFHIEDLEERLRLADQTRTDDAEKFKAREGQLERRARDAEARLQNMSFQHRQEAEQLRDRDVQWKSYHESTMQTTKLRHQDALDRAVQKTQAEAETYYKGHLQKERHAHEDAIRLKDGEIGVRDKDIKQLEDQIAKERGEHQSILRDKETRYRNDIAHLKATLTDQMEEQKRSYEQELAEAASEAAKQKAELEERMALMKQGYENEIARLKSEHAQVISKMGQDHAEEMAKAVQDLKQKITAMNAILFARDGFTPVPDRLLKEKFLLLRHDVQYLSRQSWRVDQPFWTTGMLMEITSNPDKVREQLLRDELWWILLDHVFASPFRMFGDEARTLEGQWNSGCGKDPDLRTGDFIWPQPSFEAEKFRYEAIKQCQTALKEPASHLDPRAKIRKGFIQSRERLSKALQGAISSVAEADQVVFTDIDKLVKKVIGLWLEFELQRCRLMILMPTSRISSDEDKMALAKERRLELTSLPALIRFGDDEGQDLDVRQTVGSCSEEVVRVS